MAKKFAPGKKTQKQKNMPRKAITKAMKKAPPKKQGGKAQKKTPIKSTTKKHSTPKKVRKIIFHCRMINQNHL